MRYGEEDRESENVEDRRGEGGGMFQRGAEAAFRSRSAGAG